MDPIRTTKTAAVCVVQFFGVLRVTMVKLLLLFTIITLWQCLYKSFDKVEYWRLSVNKQTKIETILFYVLK